MRLVLDIQDSEKDFFLKMLKNLKFVKSVEIEDSEEAFFEGLKGAMKEVDLHLKGEKKLGKAVDLLDEL